MSEPTPNVRERLLQATLDILNEDDDPARITVRQITERAGVAVGSVNYYFKSKDRLIDEAVSQVVTAEARRWFAPTPDPNLSALDRLKHLLKETSRLMMRYPKLAQIMVRHDLEHGDFGVPLMVVPLLREILGPAWDEIELRLLAFELISTLQLLLLRADSFQVYASINIFDADQRDRGIDTLVELITKSRGVTP